MWSWGWGVHGQTGTGTTDDLLVPTHAKHMDNMGVSYITAGFNHSAIINNEVSYTMDIILNDVFSHAHLF